MKKAREPIYLAWSGGKDSAFALHVLLRSKQYQVVGLVSCVQDPDKTVALRGIDQTILLAQADALGLPLLLVEVERGANCREHVRALAKALGQANRDREKVPTPLSAHDAPVPSITKVAFGDVYLDDIRDSREELLEAEGFEALFPLWHRDTREVSHALLQARFKALVTCIDRQVLSQDFLGRIYDRQFVNDLPLMIDPCGENGEFHTVVFESPDFSRPIALRPGPQYALEPFLYQTCSSRLSATSKRKRTAIS